MNKWIKRENVIREDDVRKLVKNLGITELLARILVSRGYSEVESARIFIRPTLEDLHDSRLLPDIEIICGRIKEAIKRKEKITIYADYDADGSATRS